MTFLQLKQRLARRRGAADSTLAPATNTRYGEAINEAHKTILRKPGRESLRYGAPITFASVASQKLYALPEQGIARINRITERDNDLKLLYRTPQWLDEGAPDPTEGTPCFWIPRGYVPVHTQPSDASAVFVDSTSVSDTGTAYVEGITSGGYYQSKSVTMTGTTAVNLSAAVSDWIVITKFYLSTAAVGTVTLHEDASGGTELSKIAIGDVAAKFFAFQLYLTPSAVITYYADVLRSITDLSNDTDEPWLPEDFHPLLIDMAEQSELTKQDDPARWALLARKIKDGTGDLDSFLNNHPDWRPFQTEPAEFSALGPWFPNGS